MLTSARSDIDNPVAFLDGLFIVLNDKDSVAKITKAQQRFNESAVIALMKTNAWLI